MERNLEENLAQLQSQLGYGVTFDLVIRRLRVAHKQAALVFLDGFVNDVATIHIMRSLQTIPRLCATQGALEQLLRDYVPFLKFPSLTVSRLEWNRFCPGPCFS